MGRHSAPETDGVRRVRTPEGVAHFKLPLESPIGGSNDTKRKSLADATPKDVHTAAARVDARLFAINKSIDPVEYDLPKVIDSVIATDATSDDELDAILDRHERNNYTPEHTDNHRDYDVDTAKDADPETVAELSAALAYATRYESNGIDLDGIDPEAAIDAVLRDGINIGRLMDPDVTPEQYRKIQGEVQQIARNLHEAKGWEANRANGADPFDGYSTTYRGTDVDAVSRKTALAITDSVAEWFNFENADNYPGARNGRLTQGATIADFDMPAVENDIIATGLNVPFLTGALDTDSEYEITDSEFTEIGAQLWSILQNHHRGFPDATEANVPPVDFDTLRGAELVEATAQGYAALSATFRGTEEVAPEYRIALIARAMDDGLNLAALNNPNLPDVTRNSIVARLSEHYENIE